MPPRRKKHTQACEGEQGNRDASATNAATPSRSRQRRARCLSRHGRHRCRLRRCCHWCCGQAFKHNCRHEGRQVWPRWGLVALPVARRAPGSRLNRTSGSTRGNGETVGHPPCAVPHGRRRRWWCPPPPLPTPEPWVRPQPPQAHAASCLALQRSRTPRYWIRGQGSPTISQPPHRFVRCARSPCARGATPPCNVANAAAKCDECPSQSSPRLGGPVGWRRSNPAAGSRRDWQQASHVPRCDQARRAGHHWMNCETRADAPRERPSSNMGMGPFHEDLSCVFVPHTLAEVRSE